MKPVLKEENAIYYVSEADMINFICENSDMEWNEICDFARDEEIIGDEGRIFWNITDFEDDDYNEAQTKWVKAFFEAHPWITKMMIVFDD